MIEAFAMARRRGKPSTHANAVEARSRAFGLNIERLLRAYGRTLYDRHMRSSKRMRISFSKGITDAELERQLFDLFRRFGLAQMADAGRRATGQFEIEPSLLKDSAQDAARKVRLIIAETEASTRASLQRIISDVLGEDPRPTQSEVARRIARQWFGPPRKAIGSTAIEQERMFSFERARVIARNELAQAENIGIVGGLQAAGVEMVQWFARPDDSRSGPRRHYLMREHKHLPLDGLMTNDPVNWFTLPSGLRTPRPMWDGLPPEESIQCRCFLGAAI